MSLRPALSAQPSGGVLAGGAGDAGGAEGWADAAGAGSETLAMPAAGADGAVPHSMLDRCTAAAHE